MHYITSKGKLKFVSWEVGRKILRTYDFVNFNDYEHIYFYSMNTLYSDILKSNMYEQ